MEHITTHVGIDAHKKDLFIAVLVGDRSSAVTWQVVNESKAVRRLVQKLELRGDRSGRGAACRVGRPSLRGLNSVVDEAITAIVPRVFSDAGERVSFPETGAPYESARLRLARAIAAAAKR